MREREGERREERGERREERGEVLFWFSLDQRETSLYLSESDPQFECPSYGHKNSLMVSLAKNQIFFGTGRQRQLAILCRIME